MRLWGTIVWIAAGWMFMLVPEGRLTGMFVIAGGASLLLAAFCLALPHTPPAPKTGEAFAPLEALKLLAIPSILVLFVVTFFEYIAEEVREHLAALGFRSLDEAIGQVELLDSRHAVEHWKASGLDLTPVLTPPDVPDSVARRATTTQEHGLAKAMDNDLLVIATDALTNAEPVRARLPIRNVPSMRPQGRSVRLTADGASPLATVRSSKPRSCSATIV